MKRCLITGIAGFIGSSIAEVLVARGFEVRGIDDLSTGDLRNLEPIRSQIDFTLGDIRDQRLMNRLCRGVDVIFHQAAIASVQRSLDDPLGTWDVNVNGTATVLAAAIQAKVPRMIFASSSAIYGDALSLPSAECDRFNPLSPYAEHKLRGELMLRNACLNGQLEIVCLRYFNVFGPRQAADSPYAGAIVSFARRMLPGNMHTPVTIFGNGSQTRDFVFVADVVQANLAAMDAPAHQVAGASFNIGSGTEHTILQTAQTLAHLTGYKGVFVHEAPREGEVPHSLADIRLARRDLGYNPSTSFAQGLAETIGWMRAVQAADPPHPPSCFVSVAEPGSHTKLIPTQPF